MVRVGWAAPLCAALGVVLSATSGSAQPRTQEESLVYTDPTMATPDHSVIGISGEIWGIFDSYQYDTLDSSTLITGNTVRKSANVNAYQIGGTAYYGHGDLLLQVEGLDGRSTSHLQTLSLTGGMATFSQKVDLEQIEVSLRYTFSSTNWGGATPYVIAGLDYSNNPATNTSWPYTSSGILQLNSHHYTPFVGAGILYEFSRNVGVRMDLDVGYAFGSFNTSALVDLPPSPLVPLGAHLAGLSTRDNGFALLGHGTLYYRLSPEWTVQVGVKGAGIWADHGLQGVGTYASVGYLHRF